MDHCIHHCPRNDVIPRRYFHVGRIMDWLTLHLSDKSVVWKDGRPVIGYDARHIRLHPTPLLHRCILRLPNAPATNARGWASGERVHDSYAAVIATVFEILAVDGVKAIDLRICPHVCVEPGKLVGCRAAKRRTHDVFVREQHGELTEEILRLAEGIRW